MENINAISTDSINQKYSFFAVIIFFFIIANYLLLNIQTENYQYNSGKIINDVDVNSDMYNEYNFLKNTDINGLDSVSYKNKRILTHAEANTTNSAEDEYKSIIH
jgi:hypothetical protein